MSHSSISIECADPSCAQPGNFLDQRLCRQCHQPLVRRYLWAVGERAAAVPVGDRVSDRYVVVAPQIWLDTQPSRLPHLPEPPPAAQPYLKLRPYHLHIPDIYGVCDLEDDWILLLERGPIHRQGILQPAIAAQWQSASEVRRIYWLWQLLQLWLPLSQQGVAAVLLNPDRIRVDGWRVQLLDLELPSRTPTSVSLGQLASLWLDWIGNDRGAIAQTLRSICYEMQSVGQVTPALVAAGGGEAATPDVAWQTPPQLGAIARQLNQLLLEQASQLPLTLRVAGGTTTGPQRSHNEDACYPDGSDRNPLEDQMLKPHVAIVCDGIGGHAGGEVASRLALRSLKLQLAPLMMEVAEQSEILPPDIVTQQLEAILRIANNLIAVQNDSQGRTARQRMATTVVLALQLPQRISSAEGDRNAHELYLAHIGDSRAYWLTAESCHPLTLDHDMTQRETTLGHQFRRAAEQQSNAGALTQALGTRDADFIHPTVQRFILEEDGVLLLCTDGLSDHQWVDALWETSTELVLKDKMPLDAALRSWLELANQRNGHDNTSVVLMDCRVSAVSPHLFEPGDYPTEPSDADLSETARVLLYPEDGDMPDPAESDRPQESDGATSPSQFWGVIIGLAILGFIFGGAGIWAWRYVNANGGVRNSIEQLLMPAPETSPETSPESSPTPEDRPPAAGTGAEMEGDSTDPAIAPPTETDETDPSEAAN
jgi:protein phosphatase